MRALRWAGASLLMLLAGLLGLVGAILCVTLILLPLGIPILFLARRLFRTAGQLVVPRAVRHPVDESHKHAGRSVKRLGKKVESSTKAVTGRRSKTDRLRRRLHLT